MDPITVSVGVGLVVTLLFTELFGLTAGGMIVPGYLALSLHRPLDLALTIAAAIVTFLLVRLAAKGMIVYGRRRIVLYILAGFLLGALFREAALWMSHTMFAPTSVEQLAAAPFEFTVIGYIIPGLIALWFDRQGVVETLSVVFLAAIVVRLVLIVGGMEVIA